MLSSNKNRLFRLTLIVASVYFSPFFSVSFGQSPDAHLLAAESEVSISAVGDIMLGSWVVDVIKKEGIEYPFLETRHHLKSSDIAIGNLEAPFTLDGEPFEKKYNFKVPPSYAKGLLVGGISTVTLANNHMLDYGDTGLFSTLETLTEVGINFSGAGRNIGDAHKPVIVKVREKRIAFFGYSMTFPIEFYAKKDSAGTAYPTEGLLQKNLKMYRDSVDFIVTSFHWSAEKRDTPKDYQIYFAHLAIDSGADLVLGHHPHILQGLEVYKNRLIAYSLGNFAFGSYSQYATDSIILKVYLRDNGLYSAFCIPINVNNIEVEFQPTLAVGKQKNGIISNLQDLSFALNDSVNIISDEGQILGEWAGFDKVSFVNEPVTLPVSE